MNNFTVFFLCAAVAAMLLAASAVLSAVPGASSPPFSNDGGLTSAPDGYEPPRPGGSEDRGDPSAARTVVSDEISSFECSVSLLSCPDEARSVLTAPRYEFSAVRVGEIAECSFRAFPGEAVSFTRDTGFLDELQRIVRENDLASFNGLGRFTYGLPDDFGVSLRIDYASGEKIAASDNSVMFLPLPAAEALVSLFSDASSAASYVSVSASGAMKLMAEESGYLIVDVRREDEFALGHIPGAILLPNEEIQLGSFGPLERRDQLLLIYCRTGRRSKEAALKLAEAGYTRVVEFGGVTDWPGELVRD
ncbi:MAG: rhodanese-like domain-containing protein [Oscillospiraceae bacterium]|nr:rhodanese-like domain-containing protein [Oscillospiraceae bacterium]